MSLCDRFERQEREWRRQQQSSVGSTAANSRISHDDTHDDTEVEIPATPTPDRDDGDTAPPPPYDYDAVCDLMELALALIDEQRLQLVTVRAERDEARHALTQLAARLPPPKKLGAVVSTGLRCARCGEPFDPDPKHPWGRTCPRCNAATRLRATQAFRDRRAKAAASAGGVPAANLRKVANP